MAVLGIKGSDGLEVIRKYVATDPVFHSVDNRTVNDLEQRDLDLLRLMGAASGFSVDQNSPADDTVVVSSGNWVEDGTTIKQYAGGGSGAISGASAGNIRIDLLWYNLTTEALVVTAGGEGAAGSGFAALTKPNMPANTGGIPLAYLYVDETPTNFDRTVAINNAGHIEDVRPAPGVGSPGVELEGTGTNLQIDSGTGVVGTSGKLVRADHQHPLNTDAVATPTLDGATVSTAVASGSSTVYAKRDHKHPLSMEATGTNLKIDAGTGVVGVLNTLARADHQHPLNTTATLPANVAGAGGDGRDARHRDRPCPQSHHRHV
jgi:hypothetical protein